MSYKNGQTPLIWSTGTDVTSHSGYLMGPPPFFLRGVPVDKLTSGIVNRQASQLGGVFKTILGRFEKYNRLGLQGQTTPNLKLEPGITSWEAKAANLIVTILPTDCRLVYTIWD